MAADTQLLSGVTSSPPTPRSRQPSDLALAGWLVGLVVTLISIGAIALVVPGLDPNVLDLDGVTNILIGVAWLGGPISLGILAYLLTASRRRFFRVVASLIAWAVLIIPIYVAYREQGLFESIPGVMSTVLTILLLAGIGVVEFWLFNWAASQRKSSRFVTRVLMVAGLNGLALWAYLDAEVLNTILLVLGFALQIAFALLFAIMQFVAIFWFMSRTKVEVIRPGDPKQLTFDDYKGQPHLLRLVKQWITLLSDRSQFQRMGGQFINGILLYGSPGTGKTLLAKCMAGEASVAFISIEGSGFRAMFWGVDVLRMIWFVRKARNLAREYGACIAYIDEIDAVGMSRGGVMGGQQGGMGMGMGMGGMFGGGSGALTRLLYEMDGVGEQSRGEKIRAKIYQFLKRPAPTRNWHVLYMGSTNRPDVLDPALTRPGRFDRTVQVDKPDRAGRREIIKYYLNKVQHDESVDIEAIVADTANATPAQIMSALTKDSVRLALFDDRRKVNQNDIDLAFQEQHFGMENPIEEMPEDQRRQIAYHEAGHAVAVYYLMPEERIVRVTIVRRGEALGYVMPVQNFEVYAKPLNRYIRDIMVSLAGHVATKMFLGEYWTGATSDFSNVRAQINALAHYGFFGPPVGDPNEVRGEKDKQKPFERFWREAEDQTERLLTQHAAEVEAVAHALLEKHGISGRECVAIIQQAAARNGHTDITHTELEALPAQIVDELSAPRNGDEEAERQPAPEAVQHNPPEA
jgi:cell division protease FtsH